MPLSPGEDHRPLHCLCALGRPGPLILGPPCCGIDATIRIARGMLCLLYAGFLYQIFFIHPQPSPLIHKKVYNFSLSFKTLLLASLEANYRGFILFFEK